MEKEIFYTKKRLLKFLGIRESFLYGDFKSKYSEFHIPKRDGGQRTINPPNPKLKAVQKKILDSFLNSAKLNSSVFGLTKNKSVLDNAQFHAKNQKTHLVCMDIEKFFPNITPKQVKRVFASLGFNNECASLLAKICTVENGLPQGAPTSPLLSALVMKKTDQKIFAYCKSSGILYSRYFDDITISGKNLNQTIVKNVEGRVLKAGFKLNDKKKAWFKPHDKKVITNVVCMEKEYDVTTQYKNEIVNSWKNYKYKPSETSWKSFMGKMGFYLYINRTLAEKLFMRQTGIEFKNRSKISPKYYKRSQALRDRIKSLIWRISKLGI